MNCRSTYHTTVFFIYWVLVNAPPYFIEVEEWDFFRKLVKKLFVNTDERI